MTEKPLIHRVCDEVCDKLTHAEKREKLAKAWVNSLVETISVQHPGESILQIATENLKSVYCHYFCNDCAKCPAVLETSCAFDPIIDSLPNLEDFY